MLWNAATGAMLTSLELPGSVTRSTVTAVAFDQHGDSVAMATDHSIQAWDAATGELLWVHGGLPFSRYSSLAFPRPGTARLLAAAMGAEVVILNADTGIPASTWKRPINRVQSVAASPTCGQLLLGMTSGQITACDLDTLEPTRSWQPHQFPIDDIQFSPDGRRVASSTAFDLALQDPSAGSIRTVVPFSSVFGVRHRLAVGVPIAFSSDGSQLLSFPFDRSAQNEIMCVSTETGEFLPPLRLMNTVLPYHGMKATDDDTLIMYSLDHPGGMSLWNASSGDCIGHLAAIEPRKGGRHRVCVSTDGKQFAHGIHSTAIRIHDRRTDSNVDLLHGHTGSILHAMAFHPNGQTFASGAEDGRIVLWDTTTGRRLQSIQVGPPGGIVLQLEWSADGRAIVCLNGNGTASVHRLKRFAAGA